MRPPLLYDNPHLRGGTCSWSGLYIYLICHLGPLFLIGNAFSSTARDSSSIMTTSHSVQPMICRREDNEPIHRSSRIRMFKYLGIRLTPIPCLSDTIQDSDLMLVSSRKLFVVKCLIWVVLRATIRRYKRQVVQRAVSRWAFIVEISSRRKSPIYPIASA